MSLCRLVISMMANSDDAGQNNDPTGLILDPNPVAMLAKPARKPINSWPCVANVREVNGLRLDHAAIPHHLEVVQHRFHLVANRNITNKIVGKTTLSSGIV